MSTASLTRNVVFRRFHLVAATCLLLLAGMASSQAQLNVRANMARKLFLAGETIPVEVTMTNLAGREVLLRSNTMAPWLGFEIKTADGQMVPMKASRPEMQDLTMQTGETLRRLVKVSEFFPLQQAGDYVVRAWVYFADLKTYLYSGDMKFTVAPGRTIWTETVGVPLDQPDGGSYRVYEVQTLQEVDRMRIYALVKGRSNGQILQCFTLGNAISVVNPQAAVDSQNQMHVLYMSGPQLLHHVIVRYDGSLVASDKYRVSDRYPRLVRNEAGEVGVIGGVRMTVATLPTDPATGEAKMPPMLTDRPE